MAQQGVFIRIGAVLTGWHQAIGTVTRDLGKVDEKTKELKHSWFDLARATATMWGTARLVKGAGDLEERLTSLGIQANQTTSFINSLHRKVVETAQDTDIRIDPSQILDAIEQIVEKTGDLDLAQVNIRSIGLAIRATGAGGRDVGTMIADLAEKFDIKTGDGMLAVLDMLTNQGKAGAFTLQNLAAQGERVTAAYAAMGRVGPGAVREMGAMLQMIRKGVGEPEQAATAFEALLRTFNDSDKRKKLEAAGIRMTDPEDPKRMRSVLDIVKDVIVRSKGDMSKLSEVFDAEAIRALNQAVIEFKQTGGFSSMAGFFDVASDGKAISEDAARAAANFNAKVTALWTAITSLGQGIGRSLMPALGAIAVTLTPVVAAFAWMSDNAPNLTAGIITLGTGFMILRPILMFLPAGLSLATIGMKAFGAAMAFASANPIALTLGAIALGIMLLIDLWPKMRSTFEPVITYISDHWRGFAKLLGPVGWLVVGLVDNWDALGSAVGSAVDWMVEGLDWLGEKLIWLKPLIDGLSEVWAALFGNPMAKGIGAAWDEFSTKPMKVGAGLAEAQARGSAQLAGAAPKQAAMNAFTARGGAAASGRVQVEVDFKNLPKGVAATTEANGSGLDVASKTGYALEAFG